LDCNSNFSPIPGATSQSFTAAANGNYAVELTENGCVDTSNCITITNVGLETLYDENNLSIYPNPSTGEFSIDLGSTEGNIQVTVYDLNNKTISCDHFKNRQFIDLKIDGPSGFYFINIGLSERNSVVKLIKY
jgi:hypothetical protein